MIRDYLELWAGTALLVGGVIAGVQVATAESQSTFHRLRELDRTAERHEMASRRLDRMIRRWDETFQGELKKGRLAERAAGRLEREVTEQLVGWERLHRRIRRNTHLWSPGRGRDVRRLLKHPEIEALRDRRETFKAIGKLRTDAPAPAVLLRERAGLAVELARLRATREALGAGRRAIVERARSENRAAVTRILDRTRRRLERTFDRLIEHETGEDFHRQKGTLLPPVSASPVAGFGRRPSAATAGPGRRTGITYAVESGTGVRAVADGLVVLAKRVEGYGNLVIVDHGDDYHSLYAHLAEITVEVGAPIGRGRQVGTSGASDSLGGPKLYVEFRHDGEPIDPQPWFLRSN